MVKQGGRVLVYPNLTHSASDPLPTTEALWAFVESLNPFTADVALAVLAQMVEPSTGDRPKYPLLQPVRITANAILRYKGIQRYGAERRLLEHRVYEEMERLRGLTFDVERVKAYDAGTDRWPKEGASWEGDRLFDIVKVEKWQETLIGGERQRIEVAWSVRAGQWAYWWLNAQGRVYVSRMARVLLELDHRENRPAAVMAKKIGQLLALWRASETLERRIDGLLQDIGELPEPQKRDKDWAGRTRDRFDEAMLTLQEAGVFVNVEWPDGYGPGDKDRSKGWVAGWLAAKVRITLPSTAPELPEPPPKLPAPKRKRRAKQPAKVQLLDGSAIRRARTERGWTQQDLARHLGIAPAYLSQIESGKRLPSKELAGKLKVWLEEA
jgi:DNA-binding XRE family transcriptional regulator